MEDNSLFKSSFPVVCKNTVVSDWPTSIPSALQMVPPNRPHQRRFP